MIKIYAYLKAFFTKSVDTILQDFHKAVTALEKVAQREEAKAAAFLQAHQEASAQARVASGVASNIRAIITPTVTQ